MSDETFFTAIFVGIPISGFIGCLIGATKNRKGAGLLAGLLLGPIGWIIMLFASEAEPDAPGASLLGVLTILLLLGGIIYFIRENNRDAASAHSFAADRQTPESVAGMAAPPTATPPPLPIAVPSHAIEIVRGQVVDAQTHGVLVDCNHRVPVPMRINRAYASLGSINGSNAGLAKLAQMQAEQEAYGELRMMGAPFQPSQHATGEVWLTGASKERGATVHLVAARTGRATDGRVVYTAQFVVGAPTPQPAAPLPRVVPRATPSAADILQKYGSPTQPR